MGREKLQEIKNSFKVGQVFKIGLVIRGKTRKKKVRVLEKYSNFILCDLGNYKASFRYADFIDGYVRVM